MGLRLECPGCKTALIVDVMPAEKILQNQQDAKTGAQPQERQKRIRIVVAGYLRLKGIDFEHKPDWVKKAWPRLAKAAVEILDFFSWNQEEAFDHINGFSKKMDYAKLEWTLETVVKNLENHA